MKNPPQLPPRNCVKPEKKNDVDRLLKKHFEGNWSERPELQYYLCVINDVHEERNSEEKELQEIEQTNVDAEEDLHI